MFYVLCWHLARHPFALPAQLTDLNRPHSVYNQFFTLIILVEFLNSSLPYLPNSSNQNVQSGIYLCMHSLFTNLQIHVYKWKMLGTSS